MITANNLLSTDSKVNYYFKTSADKSFNNSSKSSIGLHKLSNKQKTRKREDQNKVLIKKKNRNFAFVFRNKSQTAKHFKDDTQH